MKRLPRIPLTWTKARAPYKDGVVDLWEGFMGDPPCLVAQAFNPPYRYGWHIQLFVNWPGSGRFSQSGDCSTQAVRFWIERTVFQILEAQLLGGDFPQA